MRDIYLHGRLAREFGPHFRLDVASPAEAVRALISQFPKFRSALQPGSFHIVKGELEKGHGLGEADLRLPMAPRHSLHLRPVVEGSGGGSGGSSGVKIVLGVVLIAAAVFTAGASLAGAAALEAGSIAGFGAAMGATSVMGVSMSSVALFGATMLFAGVSQLLSPSPKAPQAHEAVDGRPSFLFQGVTNTAVQGCPVPLVYGRFRVGSVVASSSIRSEQVSPTGGDNGDGFIWAGFS
ncbi:tail assembly protein [Roseococcus pinisoli]|uniref:Tail assembly protein n=1 Tax=Roseococcus pinisoli TaxID=2835040 RepID=A0ABS5QFL0_9PROT|nr:hypothetical protein [Roseococcus pinisoli]MBS7812342.1 tail assembly protein [Roseococcus pinisoli]